MKIISASSFVNSAVRLMAICGDSRQKKTNAAVTTQVCDLGNGLLGENGQVHVGGTKAMSVRRLLLASMTLALSVNSVQVHPQTNTRTGQPSTLQDHMNAESNAARARVSIRTAVNSLSSDSESAPQASGTTSQQVGPPILFAHGICDHPDSWSSIQLSLAAYLQSSKGNLYPNPNLYIAVADPSTGNFSFYDGNGQVLGSPVPSTARFFAIAFLDPNHLDSAPLDFDPVGTMELPIWEKGDELALAITAIKQITGVPKVILIAHSMGGLDARSYLENLGGLGSHKPGVDTDVLALTSIDTPHLGSPLAALSSIIPYSPWDQCILEGSEDIDELVPGSQTMTDLNYGSGQAQDIPSTISFDALVDYVPLYNLDYLASPYSAEDPVYLAWGQGVSNDGAVSRDSQNMSNALTAYPFAHRPTITVTDTPFLSYCPISENPYFPKLLHDLGCVGVQESTQLQLKVDIINNLLQNTIDVEPQNIVLNPGKTQQFTAVLNGTATGVYYVLLEDPTSPMINNAGLFTASDTGVYHVVATDTATGKQYGMATVTVSPAPQNSTLAVVFAGSGTGGVTSTPHGISCRANCTYSFPSNTSVTLTAQPDAGMVVSGWGGCSTQTTSTCTVSMDSSKSVTVTFVSQQSNQLSPPTLNAVQISGSAISPVGAFSWSQVAHNSGYRILVTTQKSALPIDPNSPSCSPSCLINLTVGANATSYTSAANTLAPGTTYYWQVHALAGTGYSPGVWSNVGTFSTSQSPGQIQVGFQGSGTGTVTSSPSGINCPGVCLASFSANTAVTLSATASTGSQFLQWGGACAGASCTVSATGAQTAIANFNLNANYTLTLGVSGTGTVTSTDGKISCTNLSGTCSASYPSGSTVVLNETPGTNYTLGGWSGACSGTGSCFVVMNQNQFVMAAFNVSSQPNGQLIVSSSSFAPVFNQGTAPATIGLLVKNSSGGPMLGTAIASEQSGGAWMTIGGGSNDNWTAPETLSVTFNPAGLSPGIYNGTITLTSSQATNSPVVVPVSLTVRAPLIITTPATLPDAFSGKAYSTTLQASGGSGLTWSVDPNALPSGLTLSSSTGVISGTVGNISGNSALTFVISVTDSYSRLAQQTFTMNWRQGVDVELLDNSLLQMTVGNPLYQSAGMNFFATGGTAPYTWSATRLPPGVSLSSGGTFSGSPTTLGQFNIVLTATDSAGLSGSLTITVTTNETLLRIYDSSQNTPPLLKPVVLGTPLSATEYFEAAGGTQTGYTWTINGALPPGISAGPAQGCTGSCSLNFTGTPAKAGTYTFIVQVTDSQNNSTTSSQTWVVNSDGNGPTISTTTLPQATIGQAYTQQLAASGGVAPLTWTVLSGHLDSNLSVSGSGSLSGTPASPNECPNGSGLAPRGSVPSTFVVEVTDANGESDVQQLCVTSYFSQPTIQSVTPTIVSDGNAKTITVTGTGFQQQSQLFVQYTQQPTVYVSPTELQVTLQPGLGSPFILAGGSQLSPGNWQIRVQAPYTMPSNFGSFTIALPPPTVASVQGSYGSTGAPCTPNFICEFLISGSGFSYQTTFQVSGSSQNIGIFQVPNTLEPWKQITATNFVPPQPGSYTVQVTNPNQATGGSATASGTFQVYADGGIAPTPATFAPSFTQGDAGSSGGLLVQVAGIPSAQGTATVSTQSGGNWLTVGGQLSGSWTAGQNLSVGFNPAGLSSGSYSGSILLNVTNVTGGPGPVTVPVNMTVLAPLAILTASNLPIAISGQIYSTTIVESGGTGLTWSLAAGTLPSGLTLDPSTGIISGVPTLPSGTVMASFTVGLQDSLGRFTSRVFTMTVNSPSTIGTQTATISLTSNFTLNSISVVTQGAPNLDFNFAPGGSCSVGTAYTAGQSCTVNFTFTQKAPGLRMGAILLLDGGGFVQATEYLSGTGTEPQVSFFPGGQSVIGGGFITPTGVATIASGDVFVADYGNNAVEQLGAVGGYVNSIFHTGFNEPTGVAVDGAGNVFVADTGSNSVKEILVASGSAPYRTLSGTFNAPSAVAVDGAANVFVADSGNNAVKEILAVGGYATMTSLGNGFNSPKGIALDGAGNIFVGDTGNHAVKEITKASGYTQVEQLGAAFNTPMGVAVDPSGNVFVADSSNNTAIEILVASGYTKTVTLGSGFNAPTGTTVDSSGNVFVADSLNNHVVKLDLADAPSLSFASTPVGATSTDSPKTVTLANSGNVPMTFPVPASGNNPSISANFILDSSGATACPLIGSTASSPWALAVGASCTLPISFGPTSLGSVSGSLVLTDNNLNLPSATQTILLNGTGTGGSISTTTNLGSSLNPSSYGQSVTITATVAAVNVTAHPTGTVQFSLDGSAAGSAVTLSGGIAAYTTSALAVGTHSVVAVYSPTAGSNFTTSSAMALSQVVNFALPTVKVTPSSSTITTAQALTVTVAVSGANGSPAPTGAVTLVGGGYTSALVTLNSGSATIDISAGALATGSDTLTASYTPDSSSSSIYSSATGSAPVAVTNPAKTTPPVMVTSPSTSITTAQALTVTVVVSSGGVGNPTPTGTVTLTGGGFTSGATTLTSGGATIIISAGSLSAGSYMLTASYTPDSASSSIYNSAIGTLSVTVSMPITGGGPRLSFLPASQSMLGKSFNRPFDVAVDGNNNLFVADNGDNAVYEILAVGGYTTIKSLGSGFNGPYGVAVDGSGNVFVADTGNGAVKEILAVGGYTTVSTLGSGFNSPSGVAVDESGNVFVIDRGNSAVKEILAAGGYATVNTLGSGFNGPTGIAVDASGNVFVADNRGAGVVKEILVAGNYTQVKTLSNAVPLLWGITVDGSGNVFVSDSSDYTVKEILAAGNFTTVITLGTGIGFPNGMAVNGSGNVFFVSVGGPSNQVVELDVTDPPSLSFATASVGSTSSDSPRAVTLWNNGSSALTFSIPSSGNNPNISTNFNLNSSGGTACPVVGSAASLAGTLAAGASCTLSIDFAPTTPGSLNGSVVLTDNNLNVSNATQSISLSGTGTGSAKTTPTMTAVPSLAGITTAQQLSVTVTVNATAGNPVPTGTVTLLGGTFSGNGTLVNGSAMITVPAGSLPVGTDQLTATYQGDSNYNTQTTTSSVVVTAQAKTTPTMSVVPNPASITTVQQLSVTVTVSATAGNPIPTGSVILVGGTFSGNGTLANGIATISIPAGAFAVGTDQLTATYTPDSASSPVYNGATGVGSVIVTAPTKITPVVTATPSSNSINTTQALSVTVTVAGTPTPTGTVILSGGGFTSLAMTLSGGGATINLPAGSLSAGMDTLTVTYTPDSGSSATYNSATGTSTVTVTKATPTVTVMPSSNSISTTQALSVAVTVAGTPTPAGSVVLSSSGYTSAATTLSGGSATINVPAGSLSAGTDTLTVNYTPDSGSSATYNGASGAAQVTVAAPGFGPPSGSQPGSISVQPGATTGNTATITLVGNNGFSGTVNLTCSITPVAANDPPACALSPTSVTLSGTTTQSSTLSVSTTAKTSADNRIFWQKAGGAALAVVLMLALPQRRRRWLAMFALLAIVASAGVVGCGGSGGTGGGGGGGSGNSGTTAGTYTITVTGTSGSVSAIVGTVTLTVQ